MTIPTVYGVTQSNLLVIWAAQLRQGKCRGKKYKGKKKGTPNFIEQIDFLIGANPIEGVLQMWLNGGKYALNFVKHDFNLALGGQLQTIPDPNFYFLIAITTDVFLDGTFNDYGSPSYNNAGVPYSVGQYVGALGSGYNVGDTFIITTPHFGSPAVGTGFVGVVTAAGVGGTVQGAAIVTPGYGYGSGTFNTAATSGSGTGLAVILSAGPGTPYNLTSEFPFLNVIQQGPDLIEGGYSKYWPYIYKWAPSDGATFYLPSFQEFDAPYWGIPNATGTLHAYYAQLVRQTEFIPPITASCLTFEPTLGNGPEYTGQFSGQRILYPEYAGAGSAAFDLGSSATIPLTQGEMVGCFKKYPPRGDADFADMIEDIIKSGMIQTGASLGLIQRGVNCNDLPGAIQKGCFNQLSALGGWPMSMAFWQPIAKGDVLCIALHWEDLTGSGPPGIADDANNNWIPIITGKQYGFWYAIANTNYPPGNHVNPTFNGTVANNFTSQFFEMDPNSTVIDAIASANGTTPGVTAPVSCSITVTGSPTYIVAYLRIGTGTLGIVEPLPIHWNYLFPNMPNDQAILYYRIVAAPGTYTFTVNVPGAVGASPWGIGMLALKAPQAAGYPKTLTNIVDRPSLDNVRAQCQAAGLIGSLTMNVQKPAGDWLKDLYRCADAAPVWSGFTLKSIARSEVSNVGQGTIFISPTSSGPVATLTEDDLVLGSDGQVITVERKSQVDSNNIIQAQFFNRNSDYNPSTASEPLSPAVALFGPRKLAPQDLPMIQDPAVARMILAIEARRYSLLRNKYKFTIKPRGVPFEAMDLLLVNDSKMGIVNLAVRLTSLEENDNGEFECEAEPFVFGCNAPETLPVTASAPFVVGTGGDPGSVNTPIIFEPVPRLLAQQNQAQIWIVASGSSSSYGGCAVLISTDGGNSYNQLGAIQGNGITGITVGDWPTASDPDNTNNLSVDLTESLGTLQNYSALDRDNFTYPCYVSVGTACIPYELMTYDIATLTAPNKYTLVAIGSPPTYELRRGVFGAPGPAVGTGIDHPGGSRFAFLGNQNSTVGILKVNMDPSWIGKTLYFKLLAFNTIGNNLQAQSAATPYTFTPTGCPAGSSNPNNNTYSIISGGVLSQPTPTTLAMTQAVVQFPSNQATYLARNSSNTTAFTIPAPTAPTLYYVTIYDPAQLGETGATPTLTTYAATTQAAAHVGQPGYVYIGSITALPAGGGSQSGGGGSGGITNLGNATISGIQNESYTYGADTGAANAYVVTLVPVPTAYVSGMGVVFKAAHANTGASTLNVNGLGAKSIVKNGSIALVGGEIASGQIMYVKYDGTNFQLVGGGGAAGPTLFGETISIGSGSTSGTLSHTPNPTSFLQLTRNGVVLQAGVGNDYTVSGTAITLAVAALATDIFQAFYAY
ncbi:MAG TPA: phage tail protein [Candidatus Binatia bacterium]|nr:phage tail protein [Candidatus Binatia bacterium]